MNEFHAIESRLRRLAAAPVDDAVAERHLSTLASVAATPAAPSRRGRVVVMGAVVAGTLVGSATLAGAATGSLPGPAQDAAHVAFAKVGIEVPKAKGKADKPDKPAKAADTDGPGRVERFLGNATTPCTLPDGSAFVGNHGEYVKAHPDDPATADVNEREVAAQSPCGKPIQAGGDDAGTDDVDGTKGKKPADTGKPESPGQSEERKPADAGTVTDDGDDGTDSTDDVTDGGTDDSGKGSSGSGKGRSGGSSKAPEQDTGTED